MVAELAVEDGSDVDGQLVDGRRVVQAHVGTLETETLILARKVQALADVLVAVFATVSKFRRGEKK